MLFLNTFKTLRIEFIIIFSNHESYFTMTILSQMPFFSLPCGLENLVPYYTSWLLRRYTAIKMLPPPFFFYVELTDF